MSHYKPRFLIEVDSVRGDMDSPHEEYMSLDDREDAERQVNHLDRTRNVYLTDRALAKRASSAEGARARGYYGLPYKGEDILSYVLGTIDRNADEALDRVDADANKKAVEFDKRHEASWRAADYALSDIKWEAMLHAAA